MSLASALRRASEPSPGHRRLSPGRRGDHDANETRDGGRRAGRSGAAPRWRAPDVGAAVGYAIAPYLDGKKVPTIFPIVSSEDITQRKRSPYIVRTGWTSAQPMHPFGTWVYENLKYRKIAMIGYDFAFGWEVAAGFHRTFEDAGG